MRTLTVALAGILMTGPAFAVDSRGTAHLEHLRRTGLGTPVSRQSNDHIRLAQAAGRVSAAAAAKPPSTRARRTTQNPRILSERKGYKRVSSLVNFPTFFPGIGVVYVKPETLPVGPFLSFDRKDRLISTIYMLPLDQLNEHKRFEAGVGFEGARVDHTTMYFNEGHPGVDMPHYHYVLWHVSKKNEALVAK
jgi:hypothetical protein